MSEISGVSKFSLKESLNFTFNQIEILIFCRLFKAGLTLILC